MVSVIDFHTHIFPDHLAPRAIATLLENAPKDRNFTDGTVSGLHDSMIKNGIALSVTLPIATKKEQVAVINSQQAQSDRSFIIPFGTIHPESENIAAEVEFLTSHNIAGIKLHPEYQNFHLDDHRYFPMYDILQSAGIIIVFHAGKDPGPFTGDHALPPAFRTLRREFPRLTMIAAHMGGWRIWDRVAEEFCGEDIYFDTSAVYGLLDKELFMRIARRQGCERLVFGSDSPWFDQGEAVTWIDSLPFSSGEKEMIFRTNAETLLSL